MLTESYLLSKALETAEIRLEARHQDIKTPGASTGPVLRVCLDTYGTLIRCESLEKENLPGLWVHGTGNQDYFPVIRLAQPLLALCEQTGEDEWKSKKSKTVSAKERRNTLMQALTTARPSVLRDETVNLFVRLRKKAEMLAGIFEGKQVSIAMVCRAYNAAVPVEAKKEQETQPIALLDALRDWAIQRLPICEESELDALEVLLFTASGDSGKKKAQLALDTDDPAHTIYRSKVQRFVNAELLAKDGASKAVASPEVGIPSSAICAFTGNSDLWREPFPKVRLPALGKEFSIFSMFSAAECNLRYRLKDSEIIPISKDIVYGIQDSLNAIMAPERKGKTWRSIAGEKPGSYDQLIVYVDGKPDIPARIADFFGQGDDAQERQFDTDASVICEALDGARVEKPESHLNFFILRKASEGQVLVALAESPTVDGILSGTEWWQAASRNVPLGRPSDDYIIEFSILNKDKKPEWRKPSTPYTGQVVALLTQAWLGKRGASDGSGARTNKLRGVAFGDVLDVMLQKPGKKESAARRILSLCLDHMGPLLSGLGRCQGRWDWKAYRDAERLTALRTVSVMGIALYALGSKKEDYVQEAAFLIGRMLALADRLHACYCAVVRDGSMPPNLIGNAVFDTALDNPQRALATLAERMRIYVAWADTVAPERYGGDRQKKASMAKKILRQYKPLADVLHRQGIPESCDDMMRAHLMLGYLAKEEDQEGTGEESK